MNKPCWAQSRTEYLSSLELTSDEVLTLVKKHFGDYAHNELVKATYGAQAVEFESWGYDND